MYLRKLVKGLDELFESLDKFSQLLLPSILTAGRIVEKGARSIVHVRS